MGTMNNKICFKCGNGKPLSDFYKHPQMSDGHVNKCKECNRKDVKTNYRENNQHYKEYDRKRQRHSKTRIFNHRYTQIKQRVEDKATRKYRVAGTDMLTYEEYCKWVANNIDRFDEIYEEWEFNDFNRKLTPSIDRIDNNKGYKADNMQWITLSNNSRKYTKEPFRKEEK